MRSKHDASLQSSSSRSAPAATPSSPQSVESAAAADPTGEAVLKRMGARLLDLSARNSLLNYRHPKGKSLRVVGEFPDVIYEKLQASRSLRFVPVPRPSGRPEAEQGEAPESREARRRARERAEILAAEVARGIGIRTEYDLPVPVTVAEGEGQHPGEHLQTLFFPEELEEQLQKVDAAARTAIEETGANPLHFAFGFVRWFESGQHDDARLAPLLLLPVSIKRGEVDRHTRTRLYSVQASGEPAEVNSTLLEKVRRQFGLQLPSPSEEDTPESYFRRVTELLETAPENWRLERFVTLGFFSFARLLMWRDLNAATWGTTSPLDNPQLSALIHGSSRGDSAGHAVYFDAYDFDQLEGEGTSPITVVDADSAQHSVLVDVLSGKNLVVQGPPGTGKSQTITNLIGAAIQSGKTVLFVTQKLAALEVVARRLQEVGLSEFCLQLHSHKTQKQGFLSDIRSRLSKTTAMPPIDEHLRSSRQALAKRLRMHADRMAAPYGGLQVPLFELLWRARREIDSREARGAVLQKLRLPNVHALTQSALDSALELAQDVESARKAAFDAASTCTRHPWSGVTRPLASSEAHHLIDVVADWRDAVGRLCAHAERANRDALFFPTTLQGFTSFVESVEKLPPTPALLDASTGALISREFGQFELENFAHELAAAQHAWSQLGAGTRSALPWCDLEQANPALDSVRRLISAEATLAELAEHGRESRRIADELERRTTVLGAAVADLMGRIEPKLGTQIAFEEAIEAAPDDTEALEWRLPSLERPGALARARAVVDRGLSIRARRIALGACVDLEMLPALPELKAHLVAATTAPFLPWLSTAYRAAKRAFRAMAPTAKPDRASLTKVFRDAVSVESEAAQFAGDSIARGLFGERWSGLETPFELLRSVIDWRETIERMSSQPEFGLEPMLEEVWTLSGQNISVLRGEVRRLASSAKGTSDLGERLRILAEFFGTPPKVLLLRSAREAVGALVQLSKDVAETVSIAGRVGLSEQHRCELLFDRVDGVADAYRLERAFGARTEVIRSLGPAFVGIETSATDLQRLCAFSKAVATSKLSSETQLWLLTEHSRARRAAMGGYAECLRKDLEEFRRLRKEAVSLGGLDETWQGDEVDLERVLEKLQLAGENRPALHRLGAYLATCERARKVGPVRPVLEAAEAGSLPYEDLRGQVSALVHWRLAELAFDELPELQVFSGELHGDMRSRFGELDQQSVERSRGDVEAALLRRVADPGVRSARVGELTEMALIQHELSKQRRHLPIRQLMERGGRALQSLMPCFMMGPQSVAQYLPAGKLSFDLVIMDEASQIRPEDALGAVSRGNQLVVVGDQLQLPPTTFFDTFQASSDDEELDDSLGPNSEQLAGVGDCPPSSVPRKAGKGITLLEESESILEAASACWPARMLTWHYRSRDPSLIHFSNHEFYNDRLILFPTPRREEGFGIRAISIGEAVYEPGGRINRREAETVLVAVQEHARRSPQHSLIVVTLGQAQRELIEELILSASKDDEVLADFMRRHEESLEPLEVKNLENVQGDERDQVFVSVTFGPDAAGKLSQNFGPINKQDGHRRLNVLFTRARCGVKVFVSFDPATLRVGEESPRGLRVLQQYLLRAIGAPEGSGQSSGRPPDSDFEIVVADALRARGMEVVPQVGVHGYFIDLGIRHPRRSSLFLLGVECDGERYHRSRSARDRDRLRDAVLRNLGWRLVRIWSADWFRDPVRQADRVAEAYRELLERDAGDATK